MLDRLVCCKEHFKTHPQLSTHRGACKAPLISPLLRSLRLTTKPFSLRIWPGKTTDFHRSISRTSLNIISFLPTSFYCFNSPIHVRFLRLVQGGHCSCSLDLFLPTSPCCPSSCSILSSAGTRSYVHKLAAKLFVGVSVLCLYPTFRDLRVCLFQFSHFRFSSFISSSPTS
jgi:hypothetical protein